MLLEAQERGRELVMVVETDVDDPGRDGLDGSAGQAVRDVEAGGAQALEGLLGGRRGILGRRYRVGCGGERGRDRLRGRVEPDGRGIRRRGGRGRQRGGRRLRDRRGRDADGQRSGPGRRDGSLNDRRRPSQGRKERGGAGPGDPDSHVPGDSSRTRRPCPGSLVRADLGPGPESGYPPPWPGPSWWIT